LARWRSVFVRDAELDVRHAPICAHQDGRWPALHAELLRDPLLRVLDQRERQPQAFANVPERIAVLPSWNATMKGQPHLAADEPMQGKLVSAIVFERNIGCRIAA
jgi:hypothetical protein